MLGRAHNAIRISDAAYILHSTELIVWAHHMVDLGEWITVSVGLLIKI